MSRTMQERESNLCACGAEEEGSTIWPRGKLRLTAEREGGCPGPQDKVEI